MVTCPNCKTVNREGARYCTKCRQPITPPGWLPGGPLAPGTLLYNRYRILGPLGQGGMAKVYRAEDTVYPGQYYAIKQMQDEGSTPAERLVAEQAFSNEAQLLTRLNHPNIPRVWYSFAQDGRFYLVMELFEGQTLDTLIRQRNGKPFEERQVIQWGIQICEVLACIHEQNPPVILRDLKPENIVIDPHGNACLIDFGIARTFKPSKGRDTIPLGTRGYAPPEQYGGQTDARSDIYALGAVMHQLLSGCDPQEAAPFSFQPVRQYNASVSPQMEQVLIHALGRSAGERYPSAREMQQALNELAALHPPPPPRKKRWIWIGAGLLLGTLALLMCLLGVAAIPLVFKTATATPTLMATPLPPAPTDTPVPTWTSTPTPRPTSTPPATETPTLTPTLPPTYSGGTVAGLRSYIERLKNFLEASKNYNKFKCDTYISYYSSVVNYQCNGCQRAISLVSTRGNDLYRDCVGKPGTRAVDPIKVNSAKSGSYDAMGALPH